MPHRRPSKDIGSSRHSSTLSHPTVPPMEFVAGVDSSGRSTPASAVLDFDTATKTQQQQPQKSSAIGVWTPPMHTPGAKLVHSQYNSPMGLYTPQNVADMVEKQTGTKL